MIRNAVAVLIATLTVTAVRAENTMAQSKPTETLPASSTTTAASPAAGPAAAQEGIKVEKIAVGTAIDNRELSGEAKEFPASSDRLYCWVKISSSESPAKIKVVWYADSKKEAEVPLELASGSGRTWSSKSVHPGAWKVDVTDEGGNVLATTEFTVKSE